MRDLARSQIEREDDSFYDVEQALNDFDTDCYTGDIEDYIHDDEIVCKDQLNEVR